MVARDLLHRPARSRPQGTRRPKSAGWALPIRADWWPWAFVPLSIVYVGLAAIHLSNILANVYGNADASSAPALGQFYADRAGDHVVMANLPWFSTLIFELLTKWLPGHLQIWKFGPYLIGLLSIALMAWTAGRIAGRWAATLTGIILLCAGPAVLELMMWLNNHTTTWYSLALLAAFLVLVAERGSSLGWPILTLLVLVVGAIVGVNAASDKEMIICGLLPLLFAGIASWALSPSPRTRLLMGLSLATAAVSGIAAGATTSIMHSAGVFLAYFQLKFASVEVVSTNIRSWWGSIALLGNGSFFGEAIQFSTVLAVICAVLSLGITFLVPRYAWRHIQRQRASEEPSDDPLNAYVLFWGSSLVCLSAGFILTTAPAGTGTTRYLVGVVYAVAAMLPLFARASVIARAAVVAGTVVFLLTAIIALQDSTASKAPSAQGPSQQVAEEVASVARRMNAPKGYALYYDAAPIMWRSNLEVQVAPLIGCEATRTHVCPGPFNYLEHWYQPGAGRSFLLTDSSGPAWTPPPLEDPIATYRFGTVTMTVYETDIVGSLL
jgi:hypothetical protein